MNRELLFVIALTELVMKHGIPAAMKLAQEWQKGNLEDWEPTLKDIEKLRRFAPSPETYFEEGQ
jgi:hypothetical protein|tara:strand:- start:5082 stop:5273 length:192 start_codon:yes stop_codon:yes gene_type:complete